MKPIQRLLPSHAPRPDHEKGFALIVTLSLMILLVIIAVGLLGLGSISLRASSTQDAMTTARGNARMALMMAIGELQKNAGPDQRITFPSALPVGTTATTPAQTSWTGALNVANADPTSNPKNNPVNWLVSGFEPDPAKPLTLSSAWSQGDALRVASFKQNDNGSLVKRDLLAPLVPIQKGKQRGRIAWFIADEGSKARVDVAAPKSPPSTEKAMLALSQSPQETGLSSIGESWQALAPRSAIDKSKLISLSTTGLALGKPDLPPEYFNDLTCGGSGIPVNVVSGGMKADLSHIFDSSQVSKKYATRYFGTNPPGNTVFNDASILTFQNVTDPKKFFLSASASDSFSVQAGPNWGNLWNYANLWRNVSGQLSPVVGTNPVIESDMRYKNWLPYTRHDEGTWRRDLQHTNSPVGPVISMLQVSFRLSSEKAPKIKDTDPTRYIAQITMQPVFGIWNPYNVALKVNSYRFDWALYPYLTFNYDHPSERLRFTDIWLRDTWGGKKVGDVPTPESPTSGAWFAVRTPAGTQDYLQPGEFRLFSVVDKVKGVPNTSQPYELKSGWSEKGGFVIDLKDAAGETRTVRSGARAWFGNIVLQDTQSNATLSRYPSLDTSKVASTWCTLKSDNSGTQFENVISRMTDVWNGDSKSGLLVPEPIVSGWNGSATTKTTYLIDDLEGDKVLAHIGTWSFLARTTLQMEENSQRLRGWIDSNPRALVSNPAWDGSKVSNSGERSGWHLTSQWMGVYNPPGKPKQVGDGMGGNRGLLGEGGSEIFEPEVNRAGGRYQGFGGAANTSAGQNHSVIYDVPRSPLVSIGQFQHAQLSRYNFEPGFVVGNSYANVRIPLNDTKATSFAGTPGLRIADISFEANQRLWDSFFFSTLAIDHVGSGSRYDSVFNLAKLAFGQSHLPNPRMVFQPRTGDTSIDRIFSDAGDRAPEAIASRILIKGAFNINSTSKTAWKAMLASMGASKLPLIDPSKSNLASHKPSWEDPAGIRFNRFGHVIRKDPFETSSGGDDPAFWQSWRSLSADELDKLAEEIVAEVKARGPFRSLAEFVNRQPYSNNKDHQRKGALQAALDRAINSTLPASVGVAAEAPPGSQFSSDAINGENQAAGNASYLLQGDILQSLAPVLQARSDYFRIRTCGESVDANGKVVARAWCEAYVQRVPDYIDSVDAPHVPMDELTSKANKDFGRSFKIVSFRWLDPSEV